MTIYIVKDDYTPDYPTIYGAYSTLEIAKEVVAKLSSDDNPYGESQNDNDTIEIDTQEVYDYPAI